MAAVATVILAHNDPSQVHRLARAMTGTDRFLHVDRRTPGDVFGEILRGLDANVALVPRLRTTRTSWSLVAAELAGLRMALLHSQAEHIVVMSGSCYPLVSVPALQDTLADQRGQTQMHVFSLPHPVWDTSRNRDGGLWRFNRRFVQLHDQAVHVAGIPLRTVRRRIPSELVLHGGSQWKIYSRAHVAALLQILETRPQLLSFFVHSYVPDECCAATILSSPELVGDLADQVVCRERWFVRWPPGGDSPFWLGTEMWPEVRARQTVLPTGEVTPVGEALFARKLRSADAALVDQIDEEVRA